MEELILQAVEEEEPIQEVVEEEELIQEAVEGEAGSIREEVAAGQTQVVGVVPLNREGQQADHTDQEEVEGCHFPLKRKCQDDIPAASHILCERA